MSEMIINNNLVSLHDQAPDAMLLDFLREDLRLCGTKEGCASGDCGACTVVLVPVPEADQTAADPALPCRAVNACITFLQSLSGYRVVTVDTPMPDAILLEVREAMVDYHASQCGFCTPGFVMSMYAMVHNVRAGLEQPDPTHGWTPLIERYLGGNLCRCTGYRPIMDACEHLLGKDRSTEAQKENEQFPTAVPVPANTDDVHQSFLIPKNLLELKDVRARYPAARLLAGGTDLALEVTRQLRSLDTIIWLGEVQEMNRLDLGHERCTIGAGVTVQRCHHALHAVFPDLSKLLMRFGSEQVRARATVGGNLGTASPIGDLPPVLLALDADILIGGTDEIREVPIAEFFKSYRKTQVAENEYVVSVRINNPGRFQNPDSGSFLKIYKISKRTDDDISSVCAVFSGLLSDGRLSDFRAAFGGVAEIPIRATALEQQLEGKVITGPEANEALQQARAVLDAEIFPISDARASQWYRRKICGNLLLRLSAELSDSEQAVRVEDHV